MKIPESKKAFLQSDEPLTLFCFVDFSRSECEYVLSHPKDEEATRVKGLEKNPEYVYLYLRNQASRDYIGVYGSGLHGALHVAT